MFLHGADSNAHPTGDLSLLQALEPEEHQGVPRSLGQSFDGRQDPIYILLA
jgi:hypothetical protein